MAGAGVAAKPPPRPRPSIKVRPEGILSPLIRAQYPPRGEKASILRDVNVELALLRFQLRHAVYLKAVPQGEQLALMEKLIAVGR